MKSSLIVLLVAAVLGSVAGIGQEGGGAMSDVRLMTLDPGHFHAALIQREMYPGVAARVDVFAPLGPDLIEHLKRISSFNRRAELPTAWVTEVHASPDFFERMLRERPGNVVVLSGRNRGKIDRIVASVRAGLNVLADKPWILKSDDLPKLEAALADADEQGPGRLRHHDRALRDHIDPPARARQRSRRCSVKSSQARKRIRRSTWRASIT